ncbi:MAG: hypothetical protein ACLU30_04260 [Odoribacter splanchnicus]
MTSKSRWKLQKFIPLQGNYPGIVDHDPAFPFTPSYDLSDSPIGGGAFPRPGEIFSLRTVFFSTSSLNFSNVLEVMRQPWKTGKLLSAGPATVSIIRPILC